MILFPESSPQVASTNWSPNFQIPRSNAEYKTMSSIKMHPHKQIGIQQTVQMMGKLSTNPQQIPQHMKIMTNGMKIKKVPM